MESGTFTHNSYRQKEVTNQLREDVVDELDLQNTSVEQYRKWIQDQYAKTTDNNHSSLNNSVFRILLYYFKGKTKTDKEKFLILVDCVLEYAHLISDRLLLLSSLLDELIDNQICDYLIDSLIRVGMMARLLALDSGDVFTRPVGSRIFLCAKTSRVMHSTCSTVFSKGGNPLLNSTSSSVCEYASRNFFNSNDSIHPRNTAPALYKWRYDNPKEHFVIFTCYSFIQAYSQPIACFHYHF